MRYALIIAGGSGTRLWPMSRAAQPKQLLPLIEGRSLLQVAFDRLEGLVPLERRYVCAGQAHFPAIRAAMPGLAPDQFLGEPEGRDTVNAVGLAAAVIAQRDPDAVIAVFTADHVIEPLDRFRSIIAEGFSLAEQQPQTLVTFGINPTSPATCYGYLQLGDPLTGTAQVVKQFREKPDLATAQQYFALGPQAYLWNSGMFVWRAATLLDCIRRYEPASHDILAALGRSWWTAQRDAALREQFPRLRKVSVDFAVMEPASRDPAVTVAAIPMPLRWLDVGSWPAFGEICVPDSAGNAVGAARTLLSETHGTIVASSDPRHLVATIGCEDLIIIHTPDATLVARKDQAEAIKELHRQLRERYGQEYL
jgi:mannose-1-phosphate guanylyltransferase